MHHQLKHTACLNCAHALTTGDQFCCNCGQPSHTEQRITMHHIQHEVLHAVVHADKGFFFLIKALATRPGTTIKDYLAGKHKKYFSPFSFFFIILGVYVLSNSIFKPFDAVTVEADTKRQVVKYPAAMKTEKQRAKYDKLHTRRAEAMNFMNTRTNIVLCISTPFIAFIMFLLFRHRMYYAEQLVVMTFVNSFLNLLTIFVFTPLIYFLSGTGFYFYIIIAMLLTHLVYGAVVYHKVLDLPAGIKGYFKAFGAYFLAVGGWMLLSILAISGYIMYGMF